MIENIIYQNLIRLGYQVYVGQLQAGEIDFVCTKPGGERIYVQASYIIADDATREREFGNLRAIKDNYPKYVISMTPLLTNIRPTGYMTMPFGEYEFHSGEFGNELERYLYDYDLLKTKATNVGNTLTAYQQQGFRNMILNPILIAALTAEKELEAQEARHIARPGLFSKDDEAKAAAALSLTAYQKLKAIEPSAQPPVLPGTMTAAEIRKSLQDAFDRSEDLKPFSYALIKDVIAKNAYQWTSATQSSIQLLPFTGHSTQAVSMNKGAILKYVVNTDMEGDARFTIGAIPDYTNQKGDMRISVMIDDQEPVTISLKDAYNHNNWKMDIWRGQTRKNFFTTLKKGNHVVEIKALDDHIILDQWILDFDVDREYYVIPVR